MKRLLTFLLLTATLLAARPFSLSAQNDNRKEASRHRMMSSSDGPHTFSSHKFVINGIVALDVPDAKYNVYMADIDKEITDSNFVECVYVKDKRFRFEADIPIMKSGRLRAVLPDGKLSPVWISIYFIPGFTVDVSIHNGAFDIRNESDYNFMANAWLNKESLAVLFESMGAPSLSSSPNTKLAELEGALKAYQTLSDETYQQVNSLIRTIGFCQESKVLLKRIDDINAKMQTLIDRYADSIKY